MLCFPKGSRRVTLGEKEQGDILYGLSSRWIGDHMRLSRWGMSGFRVPGREKGGGGPRTQNSQAQPLFDFKQLTCKSPDCGRRLPC